MIHDLSPIALPIYGNIAVRWYGLSYLLGFIAAYLMIRWLASRQRTDLNSELVADLVTYTALGTMIGGRLGYCLFYSPELFANFRDSFPYWGVFAVNEGGMASHGGMIGIFIGAWLFAYRKNQNFLYVLDLVTVVGPIGVFFGRIANFINGELVGRPAPPDFPLAVKFPQDILNWPKYDFSKLQGLSEAVQKIGVSNEQWSNWLSKYNSDSQVRTQVYETLIKLIESIQQKSSEVSVQIKVLLDPLLIPRHPSQLYAALGEGLFLFLILFFLFKNPRRPGFITSIFFILYAIVRIGDEMFRMPDAHIGYQLFGLTRGQWLSALLLAIGLYTLVWWGRFTTKTIPGWGKVHSIKINRKS